MEILNNFASIYCFITFVLGAVFMFIAVCVVAMGKVKEPKNNVRFFVVKDSNICSDNIELWIGKFDWDEKARHWIPSISSRFLSSVFDFKDFGLNPNDFTDMKEGEIREVFINLKD